MKKRLWLVSILMFVCILTFSACSNSNQQQFTGDTINITTDEVDNNYKSSNEDYNDNNYVDVAYIANRSIYHQDDGRFRFLFSLQDENENDLKVGATVKIRIVNNLGDEVYNKTTIVTERDYSQWENSYYNRSWVAAAIYINETDIAAGQTEEGKFYYQVTASDGSAFSEYSLDINHLPTYTPTFKIGEKWLVDGLWELTIDSVELHYPCGDPGSYRNNDLAQYIIITYSYKNIGYTDYKLDFGFTDFSIYDESGELAEYYSCLDHCKDYAYIDVGGKCSGAQVVFGLYNRSEQIRICIEQSNMQAEYIVEASECQHTIVVDKGYAATCTKKGLSDGSHCSKCEKVIKRQETLPALDHSVVIQKAVPATCLSTGLTEGKSCSRCNTVLVQQNTIPKGDHVGDEGKCTVCGTITDAKLVLAAYIIKNGTKLSSGNQFVISKTMVQDGTNYIGYIEFDYDNLEFRFSMSTDAGGGECFVSMKLDPGNAYKKIEMTYKYSGITCVASGSVYANTFSSSAPYIYSFSCNSTSLYSTIKSLLTKGTATMLVLSQLMIQETQTGVTIDMLGFKNL